MNEVIGYVGLFIAVVAVSYVLIKIIRSLDEGAKEALNRKG